MGKKEKGQPQKQEKQGSGLFNWFKKKLGFKPKSNHKTTPSKNGSSFFYKFETNNRDQYDQSTFVLVDESLNDVRSLLAEHLIEFEKSEKSVKNWYAFSIKRLISLAPQEFKDQVKGKVEIYYQSFLQDQKDNLDFINIISKEDKLEQVCLNLGYLLNFELGLDKLSQTSQQVNKKMELFQEKANIKKLEWLQYLIHKLKIWQGDMTLTYSNIKDLIVEILKESIHILYIQLKNSSDDFTINYLRQLGMKEQFQETLQITINKLNNLKIDFNEILSNTKVIGEKLSMKTTDMNIFLQKMIKILAIHRAYKLKQLRPTQFSSKRAIILQQQFEVFGKRTFYISKFSKNNIIDIWRTEKERIGKTINAFDLERIIIFGSDQNENKFYATEEQINLNSIRKIRIYCNLQPVRIRWGEDIKEQLSVSKKMAFQYLKQYLKVNLFREKFLPYQNEQFKLISNLQTTTNQFKQIQIQRPLNQVEQVHRGKITSLQIIFRVKIRIYGSFEPFQYKNFYQDSKIVSLKNAIQQKLKIASQLQVIYGQVYGENINLTNNITFKEFRSLDIELGLNQKKELQYYGFNKESRISFDLFREYIPSYEECLSKIKTFSFANKCQQEEQQFFKKFMQLIFLAVKRKFKIQDIIEITRLRLSRSGVTIWNSKRDEQKLNQTFIIHYILGKSDPKLKVQFINCIKSQYPIPILLRTFDSIFYAKDEWTFNNQLVYFMNRMINIVSIGIHTKNQREGSERKQKGKSYLLNKFTRTEFTQIKNRHPISDGCPEIYLRWLDQKYPINIIDVPFNTPQNQKQKIIRCCHFFILHSWQSQDNTKQIISEWKQRFNMEYFICFLRDKQEDQKYKNKDMIKVLFFKGQIRQQSTIQKIRQQTWKRVAECVNIINQKKIKDDINNSYELSGLFNNSLCRQVDKILYSGSYQDAEFYPFLHQYRNNKIDQANNQMSKVMSFTQHIKGKSTQEILHPLNYKILKMITEKKEQSDLILLRARQIFKQVQDYKINQYQLIPKIKEVLIKNKKVNQQTRKRVQVVKNLKGLESFQFSNNQKNINLLERGYKNYITNVRPFLLSIQIFLKQLQYLVLLDNQKYIQVKGKRHNLLALLTDIKRKQIKEFNQPCQSIDGDTMECPKNLLEIFNIEDTKVIVVCVFGQQSSGKSTLLNFLFGSDNKVSAGQCTKGASFSYFKFPNKRFSNCDGILVIDTEGLQADTVNNTNPLRKQFDSKIVLHSLALADIVIVNTKGNLDNYSHRILESSMQKLRELKSKQQSLPPVYLILNNCSETDRKLKNQQHNRVGNLVEKTFIIPQAYDSKDISKRDLGEVENFLDKDDSISKKTTKKIMITDLQNIVETLMRQVKQRSDKDSLRSLQQVMQRNSALWSTFNSFKNLTTNQNPQIRKIRQKITQYLKSKQANLLQDEKEERLKEINQNIGSFQQLRVKGLSQLQKIKNSLMLSLQQKLRSINYQGQAQQFNNFSQRIKFDYEKYLQSIYLQFNNSLNQIKSKKIDSEEFLKFGDSSLSKLIQKIRQEQKNTNKEISRQVKIKQFTQQTEKSISIILSKIDISQKIRNLISGIQLMYSAVLTSIKRQLTLPGQNWNLLELLKRFEYHSLSNNLIQRIFSKLGGEVGKFIEYRSDNRMVDVNYSKNNSNDQSYYSYFNMTNYFMARTCFVKVIIDQNDIYKNIKFFRIQDQIKKKICKKELQNTYKQICQAINHTLQQDTGLRIQDRDQFIKAIKYFILKQIGIEETERQFKFNFIKCNQMKNNVDCKEIRDDNQQQKSIIRQKKNKSENDINKDQQSDIIKGKFIKNDQLIKLKRNIQQSKSHSRAFSNYMTIFLIKELINWKLVLKYVQNTRQYKSEIQSFHRQIYSKLNYDLNKINLRLQSNNLYDSFKRLKKSSQQKLFKVSNIQQHKRQVISNRRDLQAKVKQLDFFYGPELINGLKLIKDSEVNDQKQLIICKIQKEYYQVVKQYQGQDKQTLQKYTQKNTSTFYYNLKNQNGIRKFVYQELRKNRSFQRLLEYIKNFVDENGYKNIKSLCHSTHAQIVKFNQNLNQIGHQLSRLFVGYVHLFTICLISKKKAQQIITQNRNFQSKLKSKVEKDKKLKYFLQATSMQAQMRTQGEVERFLEKLKESILKNVKQMKQVYLSHQKQVYQNKIKREEIQKQLQQRIASKENYNQFKQYLENPHIVLSESYEKQAQKFLEEIQEHSHSFQVFYGIDWSQFSRFIYQSFRKIRQNLKENKITQKTELKQIIQQFNTFQEGISLTDIQVQQLIFNYVYNVLLMILSNKQIQVLEKEGKFQVSLKKNIQVNNIQKPSQLLLKTFKTLLNENLTISNLYAFVELILSKSSTQFIEKITNQVRQELKLTQPQKAAFLLELRPRICKQKCPGCGKICGRTDIHLSQHKTIFGHRFRAFNNAVTQNECPSLKSCEDMQNFDIVKYGDQEVTFKQFAQHHSNKQDRSWDFTQLSQKQRNKKQRQKEYILFGYKFCIDTNKKYIDLQQFKNRSFLPPKLHYIFAIDDSGSMLSNTNNSRISKWQELKTSLRVTIQQIRRLNQTRKNIKITLIIFNSQCRIYQGEQIQPDQLNLNNLKINGGGTDFQKVFQKSLDIIRAHIEDSCLKFIFMTDGLANYPGDQVKQMKELMNSHPKRLQYFSIQFDSTSKVMQNLKNELNGTNRVAFSGDQLTSAYVEIIRESMW